jgi:putative phosphoribosyl transferase
MRFKNRRWAGRALGSRLEPVVRAASRDQRLVLGLPRGGVAVASEVAAAIEAPLDVLVVRKLGVPEQPELAMGAIASGGVVVRNEDIMKLLGAEGERALGRVLAGERLELTRRETAYRGNRPVRGVAGKTVVVVDDGMATGATMLAAVQALRMQRAARVIVAVPVASEDSVARVGAIADDVVCLSTPINFFAVGAWYEDFPQIEDDEVRDLLAEAETRTVASAPA